MSDFVVVVDCVDFAAGDCVVQLVGDDEHYVAVAVAGVVVGLHLLLLLDDLDMMMRHVIVVVLANYADRLQPL